MEEEIDLRQHVRVLIQHWKMIVGLMVVAGLVAAIVSLLLPPVYEATALVSVAPPRYTLRLQGGSSVSVPLPVRAYPDLALSDQVVAQVHSEVAAAYPAGSVSVSELRADLRVATSADPSLLLLKVQGRDPQMAAAVANTWARVLADQAGQLFGQDAANLEDYQSQLAGAEADLRAAEQALADFQSTNRVAVLTAQLASQQTILTDSLDRQHALSLLKQDGLDLQGRLSDLDPAQLTSLEDDLVILSLSARALSGSPQNAVPLQLQITPGQSLSGKAVRDQLALLSHILDIVEARAGDLAQQQAVLETTMLELQGQLGQAQIREQQLVRARDVVEEQYVSLASKVEEARIAAQESANVIQVASQAGVPRRPVSPRPVLNTVLVAALGLTIAVVGVFASAWWSAGQANNAAAAAPADGRRGLPVEEGYAGEGKWSKVSSETPHG